LNFEELLSSLMAAAVDTANGVSAGIPASLFASGALLTTSRRQYAVTKGRSAVPDQIALQPAADLTITVNWQQALRH